MVKSAIENIWLNGEEEGEFIGKIIGIEVRIQNIDIVISKIKVQKHSKKEEKDEKGKDEESEIVIKDEEAYSSECL